MKPVMILAAIAAVTFNVSARADTGHDQRRMAANQAANQCYISTDNRGFGYWASCDWVKKDGRKGNSNQSTIGGDGGGSGGGGGGGGQ